MIRDRVVDILFGVRDLAARAISEKTISAKGAAAKEKRARRQKEITDINLRALGARLFRAEDRAFDRGEVVHPLAFSHEYEEVRREWKRRLAKRLFVHTSIHLVHRKDCRRCLAERRVSESRKAAIERGASPALAA